MIRGRQKTEYEIEDDMKKIGFIGGALVILLIGLFIWSLSGASDSKAPTDVKTIDVSPQL
ncbi:MAG: hypothetical protein ABJN52_16260 [Litorimonas sp.]